MAKRFFELHDDVEFPNRWHLAMPRDHQNLQVTAGRPLDFTEAGLGTPVIHVRVAPIFAELAPHDVQLLSVHIEGHPDQYLMLVVTRLIRCIDEQATRIRRWTHEDGLPDMVGQYASVRNLRIDKTKVGEARIFRPEGFHVALIVSEEIKDALERVGATGTRFEEV